MAIPDFQSMMLPFLQFSADGLEHSLRESRDALAENFHLTPEERAALLPSGRQHTFDNRVSWAKIHLERAGLLTSPRRGFFQISDKGREVLSNPPDRIDIRYLNRFPEFKRFRGSEKTPGAVDRPEVPTENQTPEEILEKTSLELRNTLTSDLLERVKAASPQFFEFLVVNVLVKMGYGGSLEQAGHAIGKPGDEGIDGIINEDRLGLAKIHIQAKKWEGSVGRPEIQKFVGALQGQRSRKGVFITTSSFTAEALEYVSRIDANVVLIDGPKLASYMIELNVGVTTKASYEVKRIEEDFFTEE
jgi:restriction system protein